MYRNTYVEVNLKNIESNVKTVEDALNEAIEDMKSKKVDNSESKN